jgi:hypothetical protein
MTPPAVLRFLGVAVLLLRATAAQAGVQVCYGTDDCTVVGPSGTQKLSIQASRNVARSNARDNVAKVYDSCQIAVNQQRCRELARELMRQFEQQ